MGGTELTSMPLTLRPCQQWGDLKETDSIRCKVHYCYLQRNSAFWTGLGATRQQTLVFDYFSCLCTIVIKTDSPIEPDCPYVTCAVRFDRFTPGLIGLIKFDRFICKSSPYLGSNRLGIQFTDFPVEPIGPV
ncbi:hypothetical protein PIB30_060329 [Stylosanthes scabra]|uniref:Uncharacterized protein n=1 Tax=Stylosanthes scabra TaxID=79078 RepID=A0ABU6VIY9_9FABA|nr:hypothetical protein [Stylosanthes scabra]